MNTDRPLPIVPLLAILFASMACATLATPEATPVAIPTDAPITQAPPPVPSPTPFPTAVQLPFVEPWPLSADLYYLAADGQVYQQPYLGDESTVSALAGGRVVADFEVAPGGDWLLIRSGGEVSITSGDGLRGQLLTRDAGHVSQRGAGRTMDWSEDGERIAYTTERGFQVFYRSTGPDFRPQLFDALEQALINLNWSPDARWLLVQRESGSAALYRADTGLQAWVELGPVGSAAWTADSRLVFAPLDGGLVLLEPAKLDSRQFIVGRDWRISLPVEPQPGLLYFFSHGASFEQPAVLHQIDLASGAIEALGQVALTLQGFSWDRRADHLIGPAADGAGLILVSPVNGTQALVETHGGAALSTRWGDLPIEEASSLAMNADLFFIAPLAGIDQLWRLPATGEAPIAVTNELEDVLNFDLSADGTQVVYTTAGAIYRNVINTLDFNEIATLATTTDPYLSSPAFSASGRQVAYTDGGIWIRDLDTNGLRRILVDQQPADPNSRDYARFREPRWSTDGNWIVARVDYYQGSDLVLVNVVEQGAQPYFLNLFNLTAEWSPYNVVLVYGQGSVYAEPQLTRVIPPVPNEDGTRGAPGLAQLLRLPIADIQPLADGRVFLLRVPGAEALGPTTVTPIVLNAEFDTLSDVGLPFVMEAPLLSTDGRYVAGLLNPHRDSGGDERGQLAIFDRETRRLLRLVGVTDVHALHWGPTRGN